MNNLQHSSVHLMARCLLCMCRDHVCTWIWKIYEFDNNHKQPYFGKYFNRQNENIVRHRFFWYTFIDRHTFYDSLWKRHFTYSCWIEGLGRVSLFEQTIKDFVKRVVKIVVKKKFISASNYTRNKWKLGNLQGRPIFYCIRMQFDNQMESNTARAWTRAICISHFTSYAQIKRMRTKKVFFSIFV